MESALLRNVDDQVREYVDESSFGGTVDVGDRVGAGDDLIADGHPADPWIPVLNATDPGDGLPLARLAGVPRDAEGFHRKMKLIQRRAYGFRNFNNYRLRVIAQCG